VQLTSVQRFLIGRKVEMGRQLVGGNTERNCFVGHKGAMKKSSTKKKMYKKKSHHDSSWLSKYKPRDVVIYKPDVGLGRSVATRLRTEIYFNVGLTNANPVIYNLLPGSAFNPMGDVSAIQPASFDQWKVLFARYLVTGATVEIEPVLNIPSAQIGSFSAMVAAYPSTVVGPAAGSATYQGYASQPYSQGRVVNQGVNTKPLFFKLSTQKIVGARLPVIAEDCGALISASPTTGQNMVLPVFSQPTTTGIAYTSVTLRIKIIQDVIFDQRIQVVDA